MDRSRESQETVGAALSTVIQAGQQLLAGRVELALLEGRQAMGRAAVGIALGILGGIVFLGGVAVLDIALVDRLRQSSSESVGLLFCAALHGALGLGLLVAGLRPRRQRSASDES